MKKLTFEEALAINGATVWEKRIIDIRVTGIFFLSVRRVIVNA